MEENTDIEGCAAVPTSPLFLFAAPQFQFKKYKHACNYVHFTLQVISGKALCGVIAQASLASHSACRKQPCS
jgi:hypothetical protein